MIVFLPHQFAASDTCLHTQHYDGCTSNYQRPPCHEIAPTQWLDALQGNCAKRPTAAELGLSPRHKALRNVKPQQCVLIVNRSVLKVVATDVWVDNLYFRVLESPGGIADTAVRASQGALLWMTNLTIQGSGDTVKDCTVCGLLASRQARIFADGVPLPVLTVHSRQHTIVSTSTRS
jgi:hypothetical protein